jgi:hypothetical protein
MKTTKSPLLLTRLVFLLAVLPAFSQETKPATGTKPNVLFLIADDLNRSVPCYGQSIVKAPNVERLATLAKMRNLAAGLRQKFWG